MIAKNNRITLLIIGATTEVATLKQALSKAEKKMAVERTEREKLGAQVGEVQQELQALMKKHEILELESKPKRPSSWRSLRLPSLQRPKPKRPSKSWRR